MRANYKLLIGELLRRLGRFAEAESHFAAIDEFKPASNEAKLADFQRQLVAKQDIGIHMMSKVLTRTRQ